MNRLFQKKWSWSKEGMGQKLREKPAGVWVSGEATPAAEKAQNSSTVCQYHPFYNSVKIQIQNEADKAKKNSCFQPKISFKTITTTQGCSGDDPKGTSQLCLRETLIWPQLFFIQRDGQGLPAINEAFSGLQKKKQAELQQIRGGNDFRLIKVHQGSVLPRQHKWSLPGSLAGLPQKTQIKQVQKCQHHQDLPEVLGLGLVWHSQTI